MDSLAEQNPSFGVTVVKGVGGGQDAGPAGDAISPLIDSYIFSMGNPTRQFANFVATSANKPVEQMLRNGTDDVKRVIEARTHAMAKDLSVPLESVIATVVAAELASLSKAILAPEIEIELNLVRAELAKIGVEMPRNEEIFRSDILSSLTAEYVGARIAYKASIAPPTFGRKFASTAQELRAGEAKKAMMQAFLRRPTGMRS
jgi:sRNA-binding carbon storage regulator CsrA